MKFPSQPSQLGLEILHCFVHVCFLSLVVFVSLDHGCFLSYVVFVLFDRTIEHPGSRN